MSGTKLLNSQNIFIAIIAAILLAALFSYSFSKTHWYDGMYSDTSGQNNKDKDISNNDAGKHDTVSVADSDYKLQPISDPSELLPRDVNSQWSTLNPNINANNVANPDLLTAGYHIGLDTIGQTLKNPNYQLRSDPLIPKAVISPWNNSTIEPDIARVPLEIGAC